VKRRTTINRKQSKENEQYEQYKAAEKTCARTRARSEIAPLWKVGQNTQWLHKQDMRRSKF